MESTFNTENIAHRRDVQTQVPGNLALPVCISLHSLSRLFVTLLFATKYTLLEYFFKCRSASKPPTPLAVVFGLSLSYFNL